jgi:hypothetical protein
LKRGGFDLNLTAVSVKLGASELSADEAMLYSKLRDDTGQQSLDSGYERKWTPRFARRGAGNAANGAYSSNPPRDGCRFLRHLMALPLLIMLILHRRCA